MTPTPTHHSMSHDPLQLYGVAEVAQFFRVKPKTIYSWVAQRKIRSVKVNGALRFRRADLEEMVKSVEGSSHASPPVESDSPPSHAPAIQEILTRVRRHLI